MRSLGILKKQPHEKNPKDLPEIFIFGRAGSGKSKSASSA